MTDHQAGRLDVARKDSKRAGAGRRRDRGTLLGVLDMQEEAASEGEERIRATLAQRDDVPDFFDDLGLCLRCARPPWRPWPSIAQALGRRPAYARPGATSAWICTARSS